MSKDEHYEGRGRTLNQRLYWLPKGPHFGHTTVSIPPGLRTKNTLVNDLLHISKTCNKHLTMTGNNKGCIKIISESTFILCESSNKANIMRLVPVLLKLKILHLATRWHQASLEISIILSTI